MPIGRILRTHGIKGQVRLTVDEVQLVALQNKGHFFLMEDGKYIPYFLESMDDVGEGEYLVSLEDFKDPESAQKLKGKELFIETTGQLREDIHPWTGYIMENDRGIEIGRIEEIFETSSQLIASIMIDDREALVPLHSDLIVEVDEPAKRLKVNIPDGLIDVYLEEF